VAVGGGLIAGVSLAAGPRVVVGAEPRGSAGLHAAVAASEPVDTPVDSVAASALGATPNRADPARDPALLAGILVALVVRPRHTAVIATALVGPFAWNAILHAAHGSQFFTDAPVAVLPASWQDTGSGVFTIAACALALGLGPLAAGTGRRLATVAGLAGLAAFVVDVSLY
jgi:hypothetical protein